MFARIERAASARDRPCGRPSIAVRSSSRQAPEEAVPPARRAVSRTAGRRERRRFSWSLRREIGDDVALLYWRALAAEHGLAVAREPLLDLVRVGEALRIS